eukprot:TRINITY_DN36395_c0_g1_i1.p1 TRINITY_DN36395_c0_g1~~TRINITY_DN36395_c0_g1_i1.p1  ORF type:complete len:153 (+),score=52.36 TRINITY_DN36395_c0_g1_i1:67-459(+)
MGACQCGTAEPEDASRDLDAPSSPRPHIGMYMDRFKGNQVIDIRPGSAADKAGLRAGDRIVEIDGKGIKETKDIQRMLPVLEAKASQNEKVKLKRQTNKGQTDFLECSVRDARMILQSDTEHYDKVHSPC